MLGTRISLARDTRTNAYGRVIGYVLGMILGGVDLHLHALIPTGWGHIHLACRMVEAGMHPVPYYMTPFEIRPMILTESGEMKQWTSLDSEKW